MAQALYNSYKKDLADRSVGVDLDTDTIRAIFVTSSYTFSALHDNFSDLTNTVGDGGTARGNGEILQSVTVTSDGVVDCDDIVFDSVTGTNIVAVVLYKDTGADGTSQLIGYYDSIGTFSATAQKVTVTLSTTLISF
jgi:hypothetical protein